MAQVYKPQENYPSLIHDSGPKAVLLGGVLLASFLLPLPAHNGSILGLPSVCPFYNLTGLPCPGCGLTRSFVCFAHGDFIQAFRWNLLGPELWLLFAFLCVRALLTAIQQRDVLPISRGFNKRASIAAVVIFLVFGVSRILWLTVEHRHF